MDRPATEPAFVERTLPAPWDEEESFSDVLDEWMRRTPWLGLSIGAHAIVAFVLMAIPWELLDNESTRPFKAHLPPPDEDVFEPPPDEPPPEVEDVEIEEPVLVDATLEEPDALDDDAQDEPQGEPEFTAEFDLDRLDNLNQLGIGGGGLGGSHGNRFGKGRRGRAGRGTEEIVERGLLWLATHQDDDGSWDVDGFMKHDPPGDRCDGAGEPIHDVGITGLALLALLGDGNTTTRGAYKQNVARGIAWLRSVQDPDTGLFGEEIGNETMYSHAIATLAICEAYYFSKSPVLKRPAQNALNLIARARNPYGAWRYGTRPSGLNDTSVTGWMVFALKSGEEAGLTIDPQAFHGALAWLDEVTDPATARVGYETAGSLSSRITRVNDHFPAERGEALTAVGLLCRFFLGQDPDDHPIMGRHADLLRQRLPEWDPDGCGTDMYYWYYGSYAMFQMGGKRYWEPWNKAMKKAIAESQRQDGSARGSWDPIGPWGYAGGRVYSTATMILCLEVYYRYAKVLGAR